MLYNLRTEFVKLIKQAGLIETCLNGTHNTVRIGKDLFDEFPIQNGMKHGDLLSASCFSYDLVCVIRQVKKTSRNWR